MVVETQNQDLASKRESGLWVTPGRMWQYLLANFRCAPPSLSESAVLAAVLLRFFQINFVPYVFLDMVPPSLVLFGFTFILPALLPARIPLFILSLSSIVMSLLSHVPWVNDWPLDLYFLAGVCFLFLRWNGKVDLGVKWSFRFSRSEILSAVFVTLVSVAVLTMYFLNNREVAREFPLPDIPVWSIPLMIGGAAIVNALREELVYRFVLQRTFQASLSLFWAVIIQAVAFGLLHFKNGFPQGWVGVGLTFLFGAATGIQFCWSRSIALVWLTHAATDASMFIIILACR